MHSVAIAVWYAADSLRCVCVFASERSLFFFFATIQTHATIKLFTDVILIVMVFFYSGRACMVVALDLFNRKIGCSNHMFRDMVALLRQQLRRYSMQPHHYPHTLIEYNFHLSPNACMRCMT